MPPPVGNWLTRPPGGPLFGVQWLDWVKSKGAKGEEPPAWGKRLYDLAAEWKTVLPGSDRYTEIGKEMVKINLDNMTIIGTVGGVAAVRNALILEYREMIETICKMSIGP